MSHVDEGRLHAYLDALEREAFGAAEWREVEAHVVACAECAARLEEARLLRERTANILRGSGPADASAPPFDRILARSRAQSARRVFRLNRLTALGWAATIVMAVGVGWIARGSLDSGAPTISVSRQAAPDRPSEPVAVTDTAPPAAVPPRASRGQASGARAADPLALPRAEAQPPTPPAAPAPGPVTGVQEPRPAAEQAREGARIEEPTPRRERRPELKAVGAVAAHAPPRDSLAHQAEPAAADRLLDLAQVAVTGAGRADSTPPAERGLLPTGVIAGALEQDSTSLADLSQRFEELIRQTVWRRAGRREAEQHLSAALATLAGSAIVSVEIGRYDGDPVARTVQRLAAGTPVELIQWRTTGVATQDGYVVSVRGPLPADTLRALLGRRP